MLTPWRSLSPTLSTIRGQFINVKYAYIKIVDFEILDQIKCVLSQQGPTKLVDHHDSRLGLI